MQTSKHTDALASLKIKGEYVPSSLSSPKSTNSSSNVSCESCRRGDILELEPRWIRNGVVAARRRRSAGMRMDRSLSPRAFYAGERSTELPKRKNATPRRIRATTTPNRWCIRAINDSGSRSDAARTYNEKVNPADPDRKVRNRGAVAPP
jgi:hypothetical protein